MALKLDDNLLTELGLGQLPAEEKRAFLAHIYEKLEMNVGVRLAEQMSEQQLMEFEQLINSGDDNGAFQWLETTFPGYKAVVADEFEKLKIEVRQVAPQVLAASQQQAAVAQGHPDAGVGMPQQYAPAEPQQPQQPQPFAAPQQQQYGPQPAVPGPQPGYDQPMQSPQGAQQPPAASPGWPQQQ